MIVKLLGPLEVDGQRLQPKTSEALALLIGPYGGSAKRLEIREDLWDNPPASYAAGFNNIVFQLSNTGFIFTSSQRIWLTDNVRSDLALFAAGLLSAAQHRGRSDEQLEQLALRETLQLWRDGESVFESRSAERVVTWWQQLQLRREAAELRLATLDGYEERWADVLNLLNRQFDFGTRSPDLLRLRAAALCGLGRGDQAATELATERDRDARKGVNTEAIDRLTGEVLDRDVKLRPADAAMPSELLVCKAKDLVGRKVEQDLLARCWKCRCVIVEGPIGIGKSALFAAFAEDLLAVQTETVYLQCASAESWAELQPEIGLPNAATIAAQLLRVKRGKRRLIVVDDFHRADPLMVSVVQCLVERGSIDSVSLVIGCWSAAPFASMFGANGIEVLSLKGLDYESEQLLQNSYNSPLKTGDQLSSLAGNPLFILHSVFVRTDSTEVARLGHRLMNNLSKVGRNTAQRSALFGRPECAGAWAAPNDEALEELTFAGLVDSFGELRNQTIREAILAVMSDHERESLALQVLLEPGTGSLLQAFAAIVCKSVLTAEQLSTYCEEGFAEAMRGGAFVRAFELSVRASDLYVLEQSVWLRRAIDTGERGGIQALEALRDQLFDEALLVNDRSTMLEAVMRPGAEGRSATDTRRAVRTDRLLRIETSGGAADLDAIKAERLLMVSLTGFQHDSDRALIGWALQRIRQVEGGIQRLIARALLVASVSRNEGVDPEELLSILGSESKTDPEDQVSLDLAADSRGLKVRRLFELGDLAQLSAYGASTASQESRSGDQWALQAMRALAHGLRGDLKSALVLSKSALNYLPEGSDAIAAMAIQRIGLLLASELDVPLHPERLRFKARNLDTLAACVRKVVQVHAGERVSACQIDEMAENWDELSPDVAMLPAAAALSELGWRTGHRPPGRVMEALEAHEAKHVLVGQTPVWSFGPADRHVILHQTTSIKKRVELLDDLLNRLVGQQQLLWAQHTAFDLLEISKQNGDCLAHWQHVANELQAQIIVATEP